MLRQPTKAAKDVDPTREQLKLGEQLKLKQASCVLQVPPKELQNLVQFGIVNPSRGENGLSLFTVEDLFCAKLALHLKRFLGTSYARLREIVSEVEPSWSELVEEKPAKLTIRGALNEDEEDESVELVVPFRSLVEHVEEQLRKVSLFRDFPRGRKRKGWKDEFMTSLMEAANQIEDVTPEAIDRDIEEFRAMLSKRRA
jgi:hypothetical protein